jgi:hypothetical protein
VAAAAVDREIGDVVVVVAELPQLRGTSFCWGKTSSHQGCVRESPHDVGCGC